MPVNSYKIFAAQCQIEAQGISERKRPDTKSRSTGTETQCRKYQYM